MIKAYKHKTTEVEIHVIDFNLKNEIKGSEETPLVLVRYGNGGMGVMDKKTFDETHKPFNE